MADPAAAPASPTWVLDKRVPLALIITLTVQACAVVWWASAIDRRTGEVERRVGTLETARVASDTENRALSMLITRIDERTLASMRTLERLERLTTAAAADRLRESPQ